MTLKQLLWLIFCLTQWLVKQRSKEFRPDMHQWSKTRCRVERMWLTVSAVTHRVTVALVSLKSFIPDHSCDR